MRKCLIPSRGTGVLQRGRGIIRSHSARAIRTASFNIGSSHIRSVPACGPGIHCPDGGSQGNCAIRNLMPEESFHAAQKKGTGSEPDCMRVIRTCSQGISI